MTRETWRKFGTQVVVWTLALFAGQAVLYYAGREPQSLSTVVGLVLGGSAVMWLMLRVNPHYYDRKRSKVPASVD